MLRVVWTTSIALALISVAIMAYLIVRRVIVERVEARRAAGRKRLHSALIRYSVDENRDRLQFELDSIPKPITADAGFEFLSLVRGEERGMIEAVFAEIGIPELIRKQLRRGNRALRVYAAERLVAFPGAATTAALIAALGDHSRQVRMAAAISLGRIHALPPLNEALRKIGVAGQRSSRIVDLFQTLGADRANELHGIAEDQSATVFVRAAAINALGQTGDFGQLAFLQNRVGDPSPEISAAALNALGRLAHPAAAGTIVAALDHRDWRVRAEAAQAAGHVGARAAIARLADLLGDEEWMVCYWAADSLRALGQSGIETLNQVANGEPSRSQRMASMVLAEGAAIQ